jgi:hypothetical protein
MPEKQTFEIPQQLRELAQKNIEQARTAYGQLMEAMTQAMSGWLSTLSLSEIKYERSDDAGRRGRASLRCSRGCELVASSAHPCSRTGVFGSDCSSSHNSAADGEGGALPRQSRGPNSPVGSNRSPARNIRSARVSGPRSADPGCPSPGYGS